ncbi:hypothetical protein BDW02DRAFT_338753 [Decorospora gaudefroyi]|uniref:Uncharacterized protein n=1 Tax=Decorospora gaudefroyi TaxID=184978 RepID=A0A6A5KU73_9PLEO|nr:hypothetical protein BDW02DRAFT_338753 [Decorospora gaudefroyi]
MGSKLRMSAVRFGAELPRLGSLIMVVLVPAAALLVGDNRGAVAEDHRPGTIRDDSRLICGENLMRGCYALTNPPASKASTASEWLLCHDTIILRVPHISCGGMLRRRGQAHHPKKLKTCCYFGGALQFKDKLASNRDWSLNCTVMHFTCVRTLAICNCGSGGRDCCGFFRRYRVYNNKFVKVKSSVVK